MKIVICGSISFAREMKDVKRTLKEKGHQVITPISVDDWADGKLTKRMAEDKRKKDHDLIRNYYQKIKDSDAILVLNYNKKGIKNYIGGNSFLEMGFAHVLSKKIYLLNPIPNLDLYFDEIKAMGPIILNGDLSKLSEKKCDHTSVGMHVWRNGKLLLIERKKFPFGFAPPAGHLDDRSSFEEAARIELEEEVGLKVKNLKLIFEGRKDNPCRREGGTWHYWKIYDVDAKGEIQRSPDETKQAGWYSRKEIKNLARRTEQYLSGEISEEKWQEAPGLEVVWYEWMRELKII